jgi:heme o synthase
VTVSLVQTRPWYSYPRAYFALTKPRVIELLLVTTIPAMVLARRGIPSPWLMLITVVAGFLAAGGANAINCYVDRDIDGIMARTRGRPLPRGIIEPRNALLFGIALGCSSFLLFALFVNLLSAYLALAALLFYVFVYTLWLKRLSPNNIVIGGAAGSLPPVIGWAAVTDHIGVAALILFAIVFVWTPPHFWALALRYKQEYQDAGVPMLPVVSGDAETRRQIVFYAVLLLPVSLLLVPVHVVGLTYLICAVALSGWFLIETLKLHRDPAHHSPMRLFAYSISYLALLFGAMVCDQLVQMIAHTARL